MRQTFIALAETWKELAAELESDQALLQTISELEFGELYDLPTALNLHSWEASGSLLYLPAYVEPSQGTTA